MTLPAKRHGYRAATAIILLVGGVGVAIATWLGGNHAWAIAAIVAYAVLAVGAYVWAGRSGDVAALLRDGGDERQRGLDRDAMAITAVVMSFAAVVGALISIGRTGNPGVYGEFCVIGGHQPVRLATTPLSPTEAGLSTSRRPCGTRLLDRLVTPTTASAVQPGNDICMRARLNDATSIVAAVAAMLARNAPQ
jgi:hypothetical protein